jgi:hypothetical protein
MIRRRNFRTVLIGASSLLGIGAWTAPSHIQPAAASTAAAVATVSTKSSSVANIGASSPLAEATKNALNALSSAVRPLSHPKALEDAFHAYFAYKAAHPDEVKKPLLYFVDYGLSSTTARGYVFNMNTLKIVDGPFTVAHGRGSSSAATGVPTRFSNGSGSSMTSLGLYVAKSLYKFTGHNAGSLYSSVGMRLDGKSQGFNDKAMARGVVAHGAPYVTPSRAGRSQGCPAMEPDRAARLLPQLSDGGLVFLFAPDANWMSHDQWINS